MSNRKVVVITRELPGHSLVVHSVERIPGDVDSPESFGKGRAEFAKLRMTEKFPEFANAEFMYSIHSLF